MNWALFEDFTAKPSKYAQNALHIFVYGNSKTNSIRESSTKLQKHGSIYWLSVGDGNILYIGACLKNIADLEPMARFVKKQVEMPEPKVG